MNDDNNDSLLLHQPPRKRYRQSQESTTLSSAISRMRVTGSELLPNTPTPLMISSWFISIGTHTKILSDRDWHYYSMSFRRALTHAFSSTYSNKRSLSQCFFKVTPTLEEGRNGKPGVSKTQIEGHMTESADKRILMPYIILSTDAQWVVERGGTRGMANAHIVLKVEHREPIMIDHVRLGYHIGKYLKQENQAFAVSEDEAHNDLVGNAIKWKGLEGRQNLYVNFSNLGRLDTTKLHKYMSKEMLEDSQTDFKSTKTMREASLADLESVETIAQTGYDNSWITQRTDKNLYPPPLLTKEYLKSIM